MKICFSILFFFCCSFVYAQNCNTILKGNIQEFQQKKAIPNVNIQINNKVLVSNSEGKFEVQNLCAQKYQIIFSCIGYETLKMNVDLAKNQEITVFLKESVQELEGVMIEDEFLNEQDLQHTQNIEKIDQKFLLQNSSTTFVNALEKVQGISAINTGVGIAKPVIRGMSRNRVIVNDLGVKQQGQQWGTDHGLEIDQFAVERLEVIKGANSLLYGSDGIGGVINILPPIVPQKNTLKAHFLSSFKSNNDLFATSTLVEGNKKDNIFRIRFSSQDFGDYKVPTSEFRYNRYILPIFKQLLKNTAGNERNLSVMFGIHRKWGAIHLTLSNFNQKAGLFAGSMGTPRAYQLQNDGNSRNIDVPRQVNNHFKAILNTTFFFGKNYLELDLGYQNNARREESNPHSHGRIKIDSTNLLALGLNLQTLTANAHFHHFLNEKNKLVYGFNSEYQDNKRSGYEFLIPDYQQFSTGFFLFNEHRFSDKLQINGGLRYDFANQKSNIYTDDFYGELTGNAVRSPQLSNFFHNISGAWGASFTPNAVWNLKLNLGKSFRMPSIAELASNGVHHGTFRHELGNSELKNEQGWQTDLGIFYKKNNFDFALTPYFNYFSNFLYLKPLAQFSPLPEGGQLFTYSQTQALTSGFEMNTNYVFLKNFEAKLGAEYLYTHNLDTSLPLPFSPPFSASLELNYTIPELKKSVRNWYFNVFFKQVSAQNRTDRNELETPAYHLLEMG
ncbi:MAG: TonB-dependent receptor, partial [Bacteroidetes bacterium]